MKTISLKVGDKLRALVDRPFFAGIRKGEIVTILDFDSYGIPTVSNPVNGEWLFVSSWVCSFKNLFHHYRKIKKETQ